MITITAYHSNKELKPRKFKCLNARIEGDSLVVFGIFAKGETIRLPLKSIRWIDFRQDEV